MKGTILELHRIGVIKFGQFEIKRDFISPFQVDFSPMLAHPKVAREVAERLWEKASHFSFELLCGGSALGNCLASYLGWQKERPLVIRRAEGKGMAPKILGSFKSGQSCLIIEDSFLSGMPTLDTIDDLEAEGLEVRDVLALIDMGLGAKQKIKGRGFVPHSVFSMSEVINTLFEAGKVGGDAFKLASDFLESVHEK